jgi:hypothetical protein
MARASLVTPVVVLALGTLLSGNGAAQDPPKAPEAAERTEAAKVDKPADRPGRMPMSILRVQLVISRFQGEKKLASLPYTLVVGSGGSKTRMRMGVDTPVPTTFATTPEGSKPASTSFQYRNVGTNIDCGASERNGLYQLVLSIENSSALSGVGSAARIGTGPDVSLVPLFRRFEASLDIVLRDGQTIQTVASTDPVSGEVVKIDVTLDVVK